MISYDLDTRLLKTIEYCKINKMNNNALQYYLFDSLNRYIDYYKDNTKLIDCIKCFNQNESYKSRFNQIINTFNLKSIDENVRLLLIKSIYIDDIQMKLFEKKN